MKKLFLGSLLFLSFSGCDTEDAPDCFRTSGKSSSIEIPVTPFEELIVYGKIKLFIKQGEEHKVIVESGENLINGISAEVENGRLSLQNLNTCSIFREYNQTNIYVTVPNLKLLHNAGNIPVESIGVLEFPRIWLKSLNPQKDPEIYTNGDFRLELISEEIKISGDHYSNFFLTGRTNFLELNFYSGDGRVEAANLVAERVLLQHRGTNKIIVNPQQELKGEIRSTGDVISVNHPPVLEVQEYYTGRLLFE